VKFLNQGHREKKTFKIKKIFPPTADIMLTGCAIFKKQCGKVNKKLHRSSHQQSV